MNDCKNVGCYCPVPVYVPGQEVPVTAKVTCKEIDATPDDWTIFLGLNDGGSQYPPQEPIMLFRPENLKHDNLPDEMVFVSANFTIKIHYSKTLNNQDLGTETPSSDRYIYLTAKGIDRRIGLNKGSERPITFGHWQLKITCNN